MAQVLLTEPHLGTPRRGVNSGAVLDIVRTSARRYSYVGDPQCSTDFAPLSEPAECRPKGSSAPSGTCPHPACCNFAGAPGWTGDIWHCRAQGHRGYTER